MPSMAPAGVHTSTPPTMSASKRVCSSLAERELEGRVGDDRDPVVRTGPLEVQHGVVQLGQRRGAPTPTGERVGVEQQQRPHRTGTVAVARRQHRDATRAGAVLGVAGRVPSV